MNEEKTENGTGTGNEKILEDVGRISYKAIMKAKDIVKPGAKALDIAESIEKFVLDSGFGLAFPLNLSINSEAAHYTPSLDDDRVFGERDVVKIDFGAEKEGFYGDCAVTVDLSGENQNLLEATESALENAISSIKDGIKAKEVGKIIEDSIKKFGMIPIRNLGGHSVEKNNLHGGIFIPNYEDDNETELKEDMVVAIEPFATTSSGKGFVTDGDLCEIYTYVEDTQTRSQISRNILAKIKERYANEPFAARWLAEMAGSKFALYSGIQELVKTGALKRNPVLVETGNKIVSQSEVLLIVEKDSCKVMTK